MAAPTERLAVIAFDAYGTLFDVFSVTSSCEARFPGKGDALAQLWRAKQLHYSLLRSVMCQFKDFWQITFDALVYAAKSLRLDLDIAARDALMDSYLRLGLFPDVRPGLASLTARGLRLCVLSNGSIGMLQAAAAHANIDRNFDAIISVDAAQVFKPSPLVYERIGRTLGVPDASVAFVSSNSWDISGARAAGLQTFWIQRVPGEPQEELGFPAHHIVRTLTDLAQAIPEPR